MSPDAMEVRRWLEKANHDRRAAESGLELSPPITDVAAFHCQQSAEKILKAYLVWQGQEFEKIHDLRALVNLCAQHDSSFLRLRDQVAPLTPYAVRYRYPGPSDPTVEQVRAALIVVGDVEAFVLGRVPPEMHP